MNASVSAQSMTFMAISCGISFLLPIVLLLYFKIRKRADILPFIVGCAVMLLFAFVLEQIVHSIVLGSDTGRKIIDSIWLYALYGGLMAGLFEETGRFLAFKTVLRGRRSNDANALMYGAGHGGFEMALLLGITMINNLIYSGLINSGNMEVLTGNVTGEALTQVEQSIRALIATPSYQFLLGSLERVFAVILQISFSVLVWFAAKKLSRILLYPAAILLHFVVDASTAVLARLGAPIAVIYTVLAVMTVIIAVFAKKVWNKYSTS